MAQSLTRERIFNCLGLPYAALVPLLLLLSLSFIIPGSDFIQMYSLFYVAGLAIYTLTFAPVAAVLLNYVPEKYLYGYVLIWPIMCWLLNPFNYLSMNIMLGLALWVLPTGYFFSILTCIICYTLGQKDKRRKKKKRVRK